MNKLSHCLLLLLCCAMATSSYALRCQGKIIQAGMSYQQVVNLCREADEKSHENIEVCDYNRNFYGDIISSICRQSIRITLKYRSGGSTSPYTRLIFEDDILIEVKSVIYNDRN